MFNMKDTEVAVFGGSGCLLDGLLVQHSVETTCRSEKCSGRCIRTPADRHDGENKKCTLQNNVIYLRKGCGTVDVLSVLIAS